MKIAQVNVYFQPAMVGGAEWYVRNISMEFVKRGNEVHVFTVDRYQGHEISKPEEVIDGIYVHRVPLWLDLSYRAKIWRGLRERLIRNDFDVIHTYDYAQPHSYVAVKAGEAIKKPVALTVFDVHSLIPHSFYKSYFMKFIDKYVARFTLKKASRVLVRAPSLVGPLAKMGAQRERICVTPSGITEEALQIGDAAQFLQKYSICGSPVILYLGRLHPAKGPQYLVEAASTILAEYQDAVFVFVGPDQKGFKAKLIGAGKQYGVGERLVFTGSVYDFEVKMGAYSAADVFVMPSGYEGTSQAIFEAMAQARPIVATNRGGIPFQVENGKEALLVEYGDVTALATAISRLLRDRNMARNIGDRARHKVKNFTYSALVNQLEGIYRGLSKS